MDLSTFLKFSGTFVTEELTALIGFFCGKLIIIKVRKHQLCVTGYAVFTDTTTYHQIDTFHC